MSLDLTSEINAMISDRNMSEEQVISLIHDMIKSAYKKKYGTDENCLIEFDDTMRKMSVYQIRKVVKEENWYSEFTEIPVEDAIELTGSDDIAEGDEVKILLDPKNFESASVQSAKQRGQQIVKEYFNDKIYADNKRKEGKLIYGEIKRRKDNGDYAVNIGLDIEASFPLRSQSPRETYSIQQKYKFLVERVEKAESAAEPRRGRQKDRERGVRIFLTRSSKDFVRALVENEVPEIAFRAAAPAAVVVGNDPFIEGRRISGLGDADGLQIVPAGNFISLLSCRIQRRKKKTGKNRNHGNGHEEFNQGEGMGAGCLCHIKSPFSLSEFRDAIRGVPCVPDQRNQAAGRWSRSASRSSSMIRFASPRLLMIGSLASARYRIFRSQETAASTVSSCVSST